MHPGEESHANPTYAQIRSRLGRAQARASGAGRSLLARSGSPTGILAGLASSQPKRRPVRHQPRRRMWQIGPALPVRSHRVAEAETRARAGAS